MDGPRDGLLEKQEGSLVEHRLKDHWSNQPAGLRKPNQARALAPEEGGNLVVTTHMRREGNLLLLILCTN